MSAVVVPTLPPMARPATVVSGPPVPPAADPAEPFDAAQAADEFTRAQNEPKPRWSSAFTGGPRVYADLLPAASKPALRPTSVVPPVDMAEMKRGYIGNPFMPAPVEGDPLIRTHTLLSRLDGGRLILPLAMPEIMPEIRNCLVLIERELERRTAPAAAE